MRGKVKWSMGWGKFYAIIKCFVFSKGLISEHKRLVGRKNLVSHPSPSCTQPQQLTLYDVIYEWPLTCNRINGSIHNIGVGRQQVQVSLQRHNELIAKCFEVDGVIAEVIQIAAFWHVATSDLLLVDGDDLDWKVSLIKWSNIGKNIKYTIKSGSFLVASDGLYFLNEHFSVQVFCICLNGNTYGTK